MKPVTMMPFTAKQVGRPFAEKLAEAQGLIAKNVHLFKKPAVAFSGGKDSTLVLWLTLQFKPDVLVVFNNTGVEYPETVAFVHKLQKKWHLNLIETKPIRKFWDIAKDYGLPHPKAEHKATGHARNICCTLLKDKPMHNAVVELQIDASFDGITAAENRNRQFVAKKYGMCYPVKQEHIQKVHPILWWSEDEVWAYHEAMNIPSNPIYHIGGYRKGSDRCGCMPCTAYSTWEGTMRKLTPKLYRVVKLKKDAQYSMAID